MLQQTPPSHSIPSPTSSIASQPQPQPDPSFHPRLSLKFTEPIYALTFSHNHFICSAPARILVYSLLTKQTTSIKVCTEDFIVVQMPPYIFACIITQFIYCYTEAALKDVSKIVKYKISKLNVHALCGYNKGYFMGGCNRSPLPGGNLTDRRSIYFMQDLTTQKKNKPQWQIPLPKSPSPITILQPQNPYLLCYCSPNIYILNPSTKQILLSFQKSFSSLILLQGRYALNCLNMLAICQKDKSIISIDVERYPIFGVELNEYGEKATAICQSREGNIYACWGRCIFGYNVFKKEKKVLKSYGDKTEVLYLTCSPKNVLFALIKTEEDVGDQDNENRESQKLNQSKQLSQSKQLGQSVNIPSTKQQEKKENQKNKEQISHTDSQGQHAFKSGSFDIRNMQERRYIEVFAL